MHTYTLTVKTDSHYNRPWDIVRRKMEKLFAIDMVNWIITAQLNTDSVVIVQYPMPLDGVLNQWFMEDMNTDGTFAVGSLLWWRELEADEILTVKVKESA